MKMLTELKRLRRAALPVVAGTLTLALFTPSASPTKLKIKTGPGTVPTTAILTGPHALTTGHLNYYGGPVLTSVRIVMVRYGAGTYLGNIAGTTTPTMASFYQQITNSDYMDWLREYDTDIQSINNTNGTNQNIGRGSFVGAYQITPAAARNGSTITDGNIEAELAAQIDAGNLPAPDANTLYMLHFPQGKVIDDGNGPSCNTFCAYHTNFVHNGKQIYYGVHPDLNTGNCAGTNCGYGTQFQNQTAAASHEMTEAITDPQPRSGWDDPTKGKDEIGDICAYQDDTLIGTDGQSYNVQKEWSNVYNECFAFPNANYYVDGAAGNDSNFGTPSHPFKTVRAAHNFVPASGKTFIYVRPTNYPEPPLPLNLNKVEQLINWNGSGTVHVGSP